MSATTPRTISNAPDLRQLLAAVGALILAVALLVAVTIGRQTSLETTSAVPVPVTHDHGWSSDTGAQDLVVSTPNGGIRYMGIPYVSVNEATGLVVATQNGGILYTGIPYPAPEPEFKGRSNGTRIAQ